MINYINTLSDIDKMNCQDGIGLLILSSNKKQKPKIIKQANSINYPGLCIFMPFNDGKYEDTRLSILNEVNNRCKRKVDWNNTLILFKITNHKANFNSKRAISIDAALKYGVSNTVEDLVLKVCNAAGQSLKSIDKKIMETIIKDTIEVELKYYLVENTVGGRLGYKREYNTIKNQIVSL